MLPHDDTHQTGISKAHLHPRPCAAQIEEGTQGFSTADWGPSAEPNPH